MSLLLLFSYGPQGPSITYITNPINLDMTDVTVYASTNDDTIKLDQNETDIYI